MSLLRACSSLHRRLLAPKEVLPDMQLAHGFLDDWTAMAFIRGIAQNERIKMAICSPRWLELCLGILSEDGDPPTLDLIYMQVGYIFN